jgi:uncharacterized short protein YbdD (DUF466 family)
MLTNCCPLALNRWPTGHAPKGRGPSITGKYKAFAPRHIADTNMGFDRGVQYLKESLAMFRKLQQAVRFLSQSGRLMVGVPDYDNYVAQMAINQPGEPVMSYEAFFRERQEARFGRGKCNTRCC